MKNITFLLFGLISFVFPLSAAEPAWYLGKDVQFDPAIPTPQQVLGFEVGDWHVRHDQLLMYMNTLASASNRIHLEVIGRTYEQRQLIHLTITSPANHQRLAEIKKQHLDQALKSDSAISVEKMPAVVWLGYSVHGNEPSGANASLLVAYYLAAAKGIDDLLNETVIILDPSLNPDGLSRFAQWANMHRSSNPMADPNHREHQEEWPSGRTNHYWFDLNRDWLLLQNPESRARVAQFHQWMPNILTDHHEMGSDSTFFFQPGIPSRQNPITPAENFELTRAIARFHADALDKNGKLYFSEQLFDDFYYGKGSTYPDIQGGIGILFEQASSRGHVQETSYGTLTFADTIKNQVTTSMSTLKAASENRVRLLKWQREFFTRSRDLAEKDKVKAYVFGTGSDQARAMEMAKILDQHQIEVFQLANPISQESITINQGFVVPVKQNQYHLIKALFEPVTTFGDQTFYDVSTWHLPSAFCADYLALDQKTFASNLLGSRLEQPTLPKTSLPGNGKNLAYLLDWRAFYAPRAANRLLQAGIRVRFANLPFTAETSAGKQAFSAGTLIIPMGIQDVSESELVSLLQTITAEDGVPVFTTQTGLTLDGADLGSPSMAELRLPKPLMLVGRNIDQYGAGELWQLLDQRFQMPLTIANIDRLDRLDLDQYTHLLTLSNTKGLSSEENLKIAAWIKKGGVLIGVQGAASWIQEAEFIKLVPRAVVKKENKSFLSYGDRAANAALDKIAGAILLGVADLSHPLCYGMEKDRIPLFKSSEAFYEPDTDPYSTPIHYSGTPLVSGYVSKENLETAKGSAAVIARGVGSGAVVVIMDDPNFRGYWYGANKLVLNSLFFGSAIQQGRDRE